MTSIIKNQLLKRLGRYVKNLSREQLHISSLRGAINLSHLEFDEDAMTDLLELPDWLRLQRMTCNKVQVSIPWTQLGGKSIKVVLDEVCVDLVTCDELRPTKPAAAADTPSTASSGSDKGFGSVTGGHYGFIEKVIDGVQLIINLVDVNFYTPRFHVSVHIDRLDVYSCTPKWQPTTDDYRRARVKSEARGQTLIFKRLDWQTMRLTAQERAPESGGGPANNSNVASSFRVLASASILLKMKRRLSDSSILFATLTSLLDETLIVLTDSQLIGACGFVEDLHRLIVKSNEATKLERARQKLNDVQKARESAKTTATPSSSSSPARKTNQPVAPPAAAQQPVPSGKQLLTKEELFTALDMQETSYHVNMRSVELQVCDETPEEGSMRILLQALHVDLYPFHCESWSSSAFNVDSLGDFDIFSSQKHFQRFEDTVVVGSPFGRSNAAVTTRSGGGSSSGGKTYLPHTKERLAWKKKLLLSKRIQFNRSMLHTHQRVGTSATAGSNPKPLQPSIDGPLLLSSNVLVTLGDINASAVTKNRASRAKSPYESPQYDAPLLMSLREVLKLPSNLPVIFVEHVEFFFPSLHTASDGAAAAASGGSAATSGSANSRRESSASIASAAHGMPSNIAPMIARSTSHIDPTWSPQGPQRMAPLLNTMTSVNESSVHAQQHGLASTDPSHDGHRHETSSTTAALAAMVPNSLMYVNVNPMQVTLHIESIEWFAGRLRYILPELSDLLGILAPIPASGSEFIDKIARSAAAKLAAPDMDVFVDCMMLKVILPTELPYELLEEMPFHGTFGSASLNALEKAKPAALVATMSNLTIKNNVQAFDRLPSEERVDDEGLDEHGRSRSGAAVESPAVLTVDKVFERILRQVNTTTNPNLAPGSKPMQTADQLKFNFVVREMQRRYEYGCTHRGPSAYRSAHNQQSMMLVSVEQLWVETEGPQFFAMPIIRAIPLRAAIISLNAASLARQLQSHASDGIHHRSQSQQRIDPYFLSLLSETVESVALVWVSLPTKRAIAQLQRVVLHGFIRAIDRLTMCIDDIQMAVADVVHEQHVLRYAPLPPSALRHGNYLLLMTDGIDEACADLVLTIKPPTAESGAAAGAAAGIAGMQLKDDKGGLPRQQTLTSAPEDIVPARSVRYEPPRHGDAFVDASRGRPTFSPPSKSNNDPVSNVAGAVVFESAGGEVGQTRGFDRHTLSEDMHMTETTRKIPIRDPLGVITADNVAVAGGGRGSFDEGDTDSLKSSSGVSSGTVTSAPSLSKLDEMYADDDASSIGADTASTSDFVVVDDEEMDEFEDEQKTGSKLTAALRRGFTRFDTAVEEQQEMNDDDDGISYSTPSSTMTRSETLVKRGSVPNAGQSDGKKQQRLVFADEESGGAANNHVEDVRDRLTFAVQNIDVIVESWPRMQIQPPQQPAPSFAVGSSQIASPTRAQVPRSVSILVVRVAVKRVKVADTQRLQWQEVQRMYQRRDEEYAKILHSSFPLAAATVHHRIAGLTDTDELKQVSVLFVKDPMEEGVAGKKGRVEVAAGGLGVELQHHIAQALGDFGADTDFMAHLPAIGSTSGGGQLPIKLYLHDVRVLLGDMPLVPRYQPVAPAVVSAAADGREKLASAASATTARATTGNRVSASEVNEMFDSPSSAMLKHAAVGADTTKPQQQNPSSLSAAASLAQSTSVGITENTVSANASTADLRSQLEHYEMMRNNAQYMIGNLQSLLKDRSAESSGGKK